MCGAGALKSEHHSHGNWLGAAEQHKFAILSQEISSDNLNPLSFEILNLVNQNGVVPGSLPFHLRKEINI
jgi:hypothetical protein